MKLSRALQTVKEMFSQREYSNIYEDDDFLYAENTTNSNENKKSNLVCVFKRIIIKPDTNEVKEIVKILNEKKINHGLIIIENEPTNCATKTLAQNKTIGIKIETFPVDNLQFNITKHSLYCPHRQLSAKESFDFKKKWGDNIPLLLKSDPICKFFNFQAGRIIEVKRENNYVSYRIVS